MTKKPEKKLHEVVGSNFVSKQMSWFRPLFGSFCVRVEHFLTVLVVSDYW